MDTVESHLMDTPQQWTPTIQWTILKVPTVLPSTLILKQPLNSGHSATLYNRQLSQPKLILNDLADTCQPFQQDCSPSLLYIVNNLTLDYLCYSQYQPLVSVPCLRTAKESSKTQPRCAQQPSYVTHTTPTGNILEASELGTSPYNGQNVGSQWCPLQRGSTVVVTPVGVTLKKNYKSQQPLNTCRNGQVRGHRKQLLLFYTEGEHN